MGAEVTRHRILMGLEVRDTAGYARYRDSMTPILARYGGHFDYDLCVERMLIPDAASTINRVFLISFPDRQARRSFFDDLQYKQVRSRWFEPSVEQISTFAEFES